MSYYRKLHKERGQKKHPLSHPHRGVSAAERIKRQRRKQRSLKLPIAKVVISQAPYFSGKQLKQDRQMVLDQMSNVNRRIDEIEVNMTKGQFSNAMREQTLKTDEQSNITTQQIERLEEMIRKHSDDVRHVKEGFNQIGEEVRKEIHSEIHSETEKLKADTLHIVKTLLEKKLEFLKKENDEYFKELKKKSEQIDSLWSQFSTREEQHVAAQVEIDEIRKMNRTYQEKLEARNAQIQDLDSYVRSIVHNMELKQNNVDELNKKLDELCTENQKCRAELEDRNNEIKLLEEKGQKEYEWIKTKYDSLKAEYQYLIKELSSQFENRINSLTSTSKHEAIIKSLEKRIAELKAKASEEYGRLKSDHNKIITDVKNTLLDKIHEKQAKIKDLETQINIIYETTTKKTETSELKENLEDIIQKASIYTQELENQSLRISKDFASRDQRINTLEKLIAEYSSKAITTQDEIQNDYQKIIDALEKQMEIRLNELKATDEALLNQSQADYKQYEEMYQSLKEEYRVAHEDSKARIVEKQEQIDALTKKLQVMEDKSTEEYKTIKQEHDSLVKDMKEHIRNEMVQRREHINHIEEKLSDLIQNSTKHMKSQIQQLETASQEKDKRIQTLESETHKLFEQVNVEVQKLSSEIDTINARLASAKEELQSQLVSQTFELDTNSQKIKKLEDKLQKSIETNAIIKQQTTEILEMQKSLGEEHKSFNKKFNEQVGALQKRYHQLHTIMLSNMEEAEQGAQSVKELISLHHNLESEYKKVIQSYEEQHEDYKRSLQEKDQRLKSLETQVKEQLEQVEHRISTIGNEGRNSGHKQRTRIDELAIPKHVTQKKVVSQ